MTEPLPHGAALALSFLFLAAVALTGAWLSSRRGLHEAARRFVHVGAGLWALPAVWWFSDWRVAVVPPLVCLAIGWTIYRFRFMPRLVGGPGNLGILAFPLGQALVLALWLRPGEPSDGAHVVLAGLLTLGFGDAAAASVGKRFGTRRYYVLGHPRTMEGSLAMFLTSAVVVASVLYAVGGFGVHPALALGLVAGTVAAGIEAYCPFGTDNLLVPVGTAALVGLMDAVSGAALGIG